MRNRFERAPLGLIATALLMGASAPSAQAQVLYGELLGSVTDSTGAVVPAATVTITNQQSGQVRKTRTGASGSYSINNVQPGAYRAEVTAGGFQTSVQTGVQVSINTVTRVDMVLQVGQVSETLTVSASASGDDPVHEIGTHRFIRVKVDRVRVCRQKQEVHS